MAWTKDTGAEPDSDPDDHPPVTPHATPILDGEGHLTYIGEDSRRYVVGLPPDIDPASLERVKTTLEELFPEEGPPAEG
ncbi:MAG: hypothetical protein VKP70_01500 [Cyanobacteriota bacterium]|nr:hypothetical protein [Cyanobacteriota bacterium]